MASSECVDCMLAAVSQAGQRREKTAAEEVRLVWRPLVVMQLDPARTLNAAQQRVSRAVQRAGNGRLVQSGVADGWRHGTESKQTGRWRRARGGHKRDAAIDDAALHLRHRCRPVPAGTSLRKRRASVASDSANQTRMRSRSSSPTAKPCSPHHRARPSSSTAREPRAGEVKTSCVWYGFAEGNNALDKMLVGLRWSLICLAGSRSMPPRSKCVVHERRDSHGSNSARHRREEGSSRRHAGRMHVSNETQAVARVVGVVGVRREASVSRVGVRVGVR